MKSNSRKRASETTVVKSESFESHYDIHNSSTFGSSSIKNGLSSRPKLRVRIKRWHGVAHWTWNCGDGDEVCGICQCAYEGKWMNLFEIIPVEHTIHLILIIIPHPSHLFM